tara:strand:- start:1120 stop:1449 length:330 start_codon:yes stop_codon:yes gene_type:complete
MSWKKILKGSKGIILSDIRLIKYVMRDGNFRTIDAIMDEVYDLILENKKMGGMKVGKIRGRPLSTVFDGSRRTVKFLVGRTLKTEFESRDTGNKTPTGQPIMEYRYIGV